MVGRIVVAGHRTSLDSANGSARAFVEGILALRDAFSSCGHMLSHEDLGERCCIEQRDGSPCIVFNCEDMLFDGLGLPGCSCGGTLAKDNPIVFHGTKDLYGILASNGVMREAINTADHKIGWNIARGCIVNSV